MKVSVVQLLIQIYLKRNFNMVWNYHLQSHHLRKFKIRIYCMWPKWCITVVQGSLPQINLFGELIIHGNYITSRESTLEKKHQILRHVFIKNEINDSRQRLHRVGFEVPDLYYKLRSSHVQCMNKIIKKNMMCYITSRRGNNLLCDKFYSNKWNKIILKRNIEIVPI